jgi:signal transduction histidine kinase
MRSDDTFKTKYDQTIRYISLARFYAGKAHLPRVLISTSMIRAALYTITYQFSEALVVYQYLEQEIQQTGAALERPLLNYNIALLYFKKKEFSKALAYAKEGHRLAEELKVPQYQFLLSGFIGLIHHRLGDFKEAYHYSHLSYLGRLAYFENDLNVKLRAMQLDYEIRNKKEELLSRKLQIIWLIVIIVFVTGITTLFIIVLMRKNNTMKRLNESLEQRVAERTRELEQSNRELAFRIREAEQYTYIASHDLQEPLQTLTNFTGLLMEEYNNVISGEGKRYLEYIGQATTKMSSLVKGFLDYSLLEKKENNGAIDCNRLLQTILGEMSADIIQAGAAIELEDLPAITGSAADIRTLFVHLLRNAIQYRQPGLPLQIRISARTDPSEWRFFIEDNGTGIPEKERSRVFDIFRKGRRHVDNQSAGLGLAYCRKIVELHGGKIWAEPALLAGTIINFTIPKPQRYDQKAEQHIAGG